VAVFLAATFSCIVLLIPSAAYAGPNYNYCGKGTYKTSEGIKGFYETVFVREYGGFYSGTQLMDWHVYHDYFVSNWSSSTNQDLGLRTKMCPKY
jgi:hypothetical protein